ncbi:MAG: HAD-IIB family hydrolase, partial [Butyrivibrio sp.]|nr:HAD-IIB family hydrolase [Butyrivibrio sp.]
PLLITTDVLKDVKEPPSKMICIELHDHEKQERFKCALQDMVGDKLTLLYSNPYYLEIFPSEAGKGSAVKRLAEILSVDIKDTYAAGDEQNDISMIKAAGCGIAMVNGTDLVKKSADVITTYDNDHDGLAEFILGAID